jgi:predicted kinase
VLVAGVVGTGKSTAAAEIAGAAGGAAISSDRVRKRLAGLPPEARAGARPDRGIYTREQTERTYAGLLERARPLLCSGRVAVLDATYSQRRHRDAARRLAAEHRAPCFCVETRCDEAEVLARLARRRDAGRDPSDAGPELYAASAARFEPLVEWPAGLRLEVRTDRDGWRERLRDWASRVPGAARAG